MRRCLIGIGLWFVACGEPSSAGLRPADVAEDDRLPTPADPSAAAPTAATLPAAISEAATTPAAISEASTASAGEAPAGELPLAEMAAEGSAAAAEASSTPPAAAEPAPSAADGAIATVLDVAPGQPSATPPDMSNEPAPADETSPPTAPVDVPSDAPLVTVSLTFDDTYGEQVEAAAILEAHGLRGTFYVNSPQLHRASANPGSNAAMSIADVLDMQARGHDIGGHTLGHLSLTDVPEAERIREIMADRAQLLHLGLEARSFAYPYGHVEDDRDRSLGRPVLEIARDSGYTSARDTNGFNLDGCARGPETVPPRDPFILRSIRSVNEPPSDDEPARPLDTAATLLGWIDHAASCGGGWLPLVFHHLRDDCSAPDAPDGYCFDFSELDRLAASLATGRRCPDDGDCYAVAAAPVAAVIGTTTLATAPEVAGLRNASLERTLDSGETECIRYDGDGERVTFSHSTELANSGQASDRLSITSYDEPAEIGVERDYGECAVFAGAGRVYQLSLHYQADPLAPTPRLRFVTYRLTSDYEWDEWDAGAAFSARTPGQWVQLFFTTPPVPDGTIALSFGLRQESAGAINVDDLDATLLDE
jgi:peptidoglycan/xylan/chitin deacetylase (PgdA/CDA1 family)